MFGPVNAVSEVEGVVLMADPPAALNHVSLQRSCITHQLLPPFFTNRVDTSKHFVDCHND